LIKLTKKDKDLLQKYNENLSEESTLELERLWTLRDQLTQINEITLPTLAQYVSVTTKVSDLTASMDSCKDEDLPWIIDSISKLQKIQIAYTKLLKLDEKIATKSRNKFADLLLK
jgi:hypothetical protein